MPGLRLLLLTEAVLFSLVSSAAEYRVGPGEALSELDDVPWEALAPGDTVSVLWRPESYRSKIILAVRATADRPFVLRGVPGPGGELPVIDGRDATTRPGINFWNETRGLVKIGGSNNPPCSPPQCVPSWITVENLDLRSARPPYTFTGRSGQAAYDQNAASLYIEVGRNITIRNCRLHDSGNGLFIGVYNGETQNILVEGNYLYDNGNEGSVYEHNSYTAARGIIFQYNRYGSLRAGCLGNNLKDRSAGLVVRYNWIENGNRQLDLVDGEDSPAVPDDPLYRQTFVYGNVLIEAEGEGNSQIVHYGGDSGDTSIYRKGTLYFYHNTVISTRSGNTTLLRLSTNDEHCDLRNNIVWVTAPGSSLALLSSAGSLFMSHNLIKPGFVTSHDTFTGTLQDDGTTVNAADAGFVDLEGQDFHLLASSPAVDAAGELAAAEEIPSRQYLPHQGGEARPLCGNLDLGAFEYCAVLVDASDGGEELDAGLADAADAANGDGFDAGGEDAEFPRDEGPPADPGQPSDSTPDAGPGDADGGLLPSDGPGSLRGSCSCSAPPGSAPGLALLFSAWLVLARRRRT
jgi:hypothetical protein